MINFLQPFTHQKRCGFLAAYAAGAKHCYLGGHALAKQSVPFGAEPEREVPETPCARVDGASKATRFHLVIVAGVDQYSTWFADQVIPVLR